MEVREAFKYLPGEVKKAFGFPQHNFDICESSKINFERIEILQKKCIGNKCIELKYIRVM